MGRIKELIKSFINPAPKEQSFDELAVAAGIGEADLIALKESMGGVNWQFDEEIEEPKKGRRPKVVQKETQVQATQKRVETEKDLGMDR